MNKNKLEEILRECHSAGENDTTTEDVLLDGASAFIDSNIPDDLSDEEREEAITAYRQGFIGRPVPFIDDMPKLVVLDASDGELYIVHGFNEDVDAEEYIEAKLGVNTSDAQWQIVNGAGAINHSEYDDSPLEDEWCTKCGKSGRFTNSMCESCTNERS